MTFNRSQYDELVAQVVNRAFECGEHTGDMNEYAALYQRLDDAKSKLATYVQSLE